MRRKSRSGHPLMLQSQRDPAAPVSSQLCGALANFVFCFRNHAGVAGTMELLNSRTISTQPISCFDWSPDKEGLAVCGSFDQMVRVVIVTKTNKL